MVVYKLIVLFVITLLITGCSSGAPASSLPSQTSLNQAAVPPSSLSISIAAFQYGQPIPQKFTCQGENVSPAMAWSGVPAGTKSLALVLEDPDAPGLTFIHWLIYNLPPTLSGLPEKVAAGDQVPGIGTQGPGSSASAGYTGPCPPSGKAHHYFFNLYALDLDPSLPTGLNAADLQRQMTGQRPIRVG